MEIIHVVLGKANPQRMNGVNKVVHQLATQQVLAGKQVTVWGITADPSHNYPPRIFNTKLFRAYKNKFRLDPELLSALDAIGHPVHFHFHGGFNPVFSSLSKELSKRGLPFVFTPHGAYNRIAMKKSSFRKRLFLRFFELPMLKRASAIHSLGASEVDGLQRFYPNEKAALIPYGFEADENITAQSDPNRFVIGFCGRIDIYTKGLDLLLRAFVKFREVVPGAELWLIGGGPEEKRLKRMIEKAGRQGIWMFGSRFGEEKESLLRQIHVFAHPSRNEGLPTAVLEAAALGIPCVVTRATNLGAAIEMYDAGVSVNKPDASELATAFSDLHRRLQQDHNGYFRDAAKKMVQDAFNWEGIVKRFDQLYKIS